MSSTQPFPDHNYDTSHLLGFKNYKFTVSCYIIGSSLMSRQYDTSCKYGLTKQNIKCEEITDIYPHLLR